MKEVENRDAAHGRPAVRCGIPGRVLTALLTAICLLPALSSGQDQPGVWQNHGPTGVIDVAHLFVMDTDPPTLFASAPGGGLAVSDNGGISWEPQKMTAHRFFAAADRILAASAGRIYISDDGSVWQDASVPELFTQFGDAVTQIVAIGDTLLAATGESGVLNSHDGGLTWQAGTLPEQVDRINALLAADGIVYAGAGRAFEGAPAFGLFRSDDRGQSWIQVEAPMDDLDISALLAVGSILYVGTEGQGLFHGGAGDWQQSPAPLDDKSVRLLFAAGDSLVYGGLVGGGAVVTADSGQTWQPAPAAIAAQDIMAFTTLDSTLYIGTAGSGVFLSYDGLQWTQARAPMDVLTISDFGAAGSTLYAATMAEGVFRSADGLTWIPVAELTGPLFIRDMVLDDHFMIAASANGVFRSVDGGATWVTANPPLDILDVRSLVHFNGILLATTVEDGVFSSRDGLEWRQADPPLANQLIRANLAVDGTLLLGSLGGGIFSSSDGLTWQSSSPVGSVATLFFQEGALYAGSVGQGLFRSIDGGASWNPVDSPMNGLTVIKLVASDHTLLALAYAQVDVVGDILRPGSAARLFRSPDGLAWTELEVPAPANQVRTFLAHEGDLYLGYHVGFGTLRSSDAGDTWQALSAPWDRFPMQYLVSVQDALFSGAIFFSPQGGPGGIYRSLDNGATWTELNKELTLLSAMSGLEYFPLLNRLYVASGGISYQEVDFTSPEARSLTIANEAGYTSEQVITVYAEAVDADSIALSEDAAFAEPLWRRYTQLPKLQLSDGDGMKTIHAKFKDYSANESAVVSTQIILDQSPPEFQSHVVPDTVSLGRPVTVTQVVSDDNLASVELFFRHPGEGFSRNRSVIFDGDTAMIDSVFVNNKGLDYRIVATDLANQSDTLRNGDLTFFSLPVALSPGELGSSPGLPGGVGGNAFRLLSIPMQLRGSPGVTEVLGNLGANGADGDWIFWNYLGGGQWQQGSGVALQTGSGYFILLREGKTVTNAQSGATMATSAGIVGGVPGWHVRGNDWTLIGNPYNSEIDLRLLRLASQNLPLDLPSPEVQVWAYDGRDEDNGWTRDNLSLEPWGGLAIFSQTADTLVFSNPREPIGPPSGAGPTKTAVQDRSAAAAGWRVRITAEGASFSDRSNYFGVVPNAEVGWDRHDWYEPPRLPGGVSLFFAQSAAHPDLALAADIRPAAEAGHVWNFTVAADPAAALTLKFHDIPALPADAAMLLIDDTGLARDLAMVSEVPLRIPRNSAQRSYTIIFGKRDFVDRETAGRSLVPASFALRQNYPNPFNPTTAIPFDLPVAGAVSLRLFDIQGREVATLVDGQLMGPGFHEAVADLRGFPSGIYFYAIAVAGEAPFKKTRKMLMIK